MLERLRGGKAHAQQPAQREQHAVAHPRAEAIDEDSHEDARGDRERHVEHEDRVDLRIGELHRHRDHRHQRDVREPDDEADEEREPCEVQQPNARLAEVEQGKASAWSGRGGHVVGPILIQLVAGARWG